MQYNLPSLHHRLGTSRSHKGGGGGDGRLFSKAVGDVCNDSNHPVPRCCDANVADAVDLNCVARECTLAGTHTVSLNFILIHTDTGHKARRKNFDDTEDFGDYCILESKEAKCCALPVVRELMWCRM